MTRERLLQEVQGWLELGLPDAALQRLQPLLADPETRQLATMLQVEALIIADRHADALGTIDRMREQAPDKEWLDLKEAWCRKRTGDLQGAASCMERMLARTHHSAIGHFNLGCYLALLGERERALQEVTIACGIDPSFRSAAGNELDLVSLRDDPRFQELFPKT
jgi:predicted Zn-dependent protease